MVRIVLVLMVLLQAGFLYVRTRPLLPGARDALLVVLFASMLSGIVVLAVPHDRWARLAATLRGWLGATRRQHVILFLVLGTLALGASALTQQYPSWDERRIVRAASIVADQGAGAFFERYKGDVYLARQHPPLLLLLYGGLMRLAENDVLALRAIDALFGVAALVFAYLFLAEVGGVQRGFLAAILLLASPLFIRIGSAVTNDMPITCLFLLALYLAERMRRSNDGRLVVPLALAIGLGLITKYSLVLVYPVLFVTPLLERTLMRDLRRLVWAILLSLVPLASWLLFAHSIGVLEGQFDRLTAYSSAATRTKWGRGWAMDAVLTKMPSALGIYTVPLLAIGAIDVLRLRSTYDRLLVLWLLLVCVPLLLGLPDNRYFLPAFPAFAAISARALERHAGWRAPVIALAWLLCAATVAYYDLIDLTNPVFLFRRF